jgi:hypothetical protein
LIALPSPASAELDEGSIGIALVAETDAPEDDRSRMYIVDHVDPGAELRREIEVQNASSSPRHIELYPAAASVQGGAFAAADGHGGNDLSEWTTLDESALDLAPGEIERVGVTIAVPETAPEGERYAAILAEVAAPHPEDSMVQQVNRVGIRVYLSVGPGGEPPSDFTIDGIGLRAGDEWPVVTAEVTNTGERALDIAGTASLRREVGTMNAGPFETRSAVTLLPGESGVAEIDVDEALPGGAWNAEVTLASGDLERTAAGSVTLPGPAEVDDGGNWPVIALIVGIAVLALIAMLLLGRRFLANRS